MRVECAPAPWDSVNPLDDTPQVSGPAADRFAALLELAPEAMVGVNVAGHIELVNSHVVEMFGYSREELVGQPVEMLMRERVGADGGRERAAWFDDPRTRVIGAGEDLYARRKDGTEFPCEISLSQVDIHGGRFALAAVRDLTRRREPDLRFEQLLEFAPDAVVGVDDGGRIELVHSQVVTMFVYSREDLVGEPIERLIPERVHRLHEGHRSAYFANPRTRPMGAGLDLYARRSDGSEFPCEISLSSIETRAGRVGLAAVRDVTDRHRAEGDLRKDAA